ncbi:MULTISPECIES: HAD family hydrolase [unclassified Geodermatophilus]
MTQDKRPGVLFDVDGTLLDTNYLQVLAWWQAFRDTGHEDVSMADCHRAIGIASEQLVTHLLGDDGAADAEEVSEAKNRRYEPLRELVTPFPRVDDLLAACRDRGLAVVLATSGKDSDLEWMVPAIGGEDVVDGSTTSADVESAKPAPDLLQTAAGQHGLDPARTVTVGDTVWDVRAAKDAGFPCIALTCGGISRAELVEEGADEVYDTPADLLAHLDESLIGKLTGD